MMQFRLQLLHSSHFSCRLMKPVSHNVPQKGTKTIHRLPFPRTTPSRTPAARSGRAHCNHSTLGPTARAVADQIHDDPRATHLADEVRARTAHSEVQHCSNSQRAHGASLHGRVDAAQQPRPTAQTLEELGRDFDWKGQWYPVSFTCNLREDVPTRVTLFDEDYVVGGLTPEGLLQCAYHGWAFDGSGACRDIPQLPAGAGVPLATCATAFPAVEHEGMLWLRPTPLPPGQPFNYSGFDPVKELHGLTPEDEMGGMVWNRQYTYDLPRIDYTLQLDNLCDPDHGVFSHLTYALDTHAGSPQLPLAVTAARRHGRPTITSTVPGVVKMGPETVDAEKLREAPQASIVFEAPSHVVWSRRSERGDLIGIVDFWVIPTGVGRCRLMSRDANSAHEMNSLSFIRRPQQEPWRSFAIWVTDFQEQDMALMASQQPALLAAEAQALSSSLSENTAMAERHAAGVAADSAEPSSSNSLRRAPPRSAVFLSLAPSDALLAAVGRWFDDALPSMPNRARVLLAQYYSGGDMMQQPARKEVLDRFKNSTLVNAASLRAYHHFKFARNALAGVAAVAAWVAASVGFNSIILTLAATAAAVVSAWGARKCSSIAAAFTYSYTPERQMQDRARIAPLIAHLAQHPAESDAAEAGITATP